MAKEKHFSPEHATGQFHCPHCGVYAKQRWSHLSAVGDAHTTYWGHGPVKDPSSIQGRTLQTGTLSDAWTISFCEHCGDAIIWFDKKIIYPKKITADSPNQDLSEEIKKDYREAANVLADSPRSAAAILRLAVQKLCKQLGEKGENINDDIAALVKKGLNPTIQKSLDVLRITGNNAVHPGELDLTEDLDRATKLFGLLNFISEKMLTEPKEIDSFYDGLPQEAKKAVEKRDNNKTP